MADRFGSATDLVPLLTGEPVDQVASRELCTLLVTDLVDSGRVVTKIGDRRSVDVGTRHDQITRDLLHRHGGREIDKSDGFLLLFRRAIEAVAFALDYHAALAKLSKEEDVDLRTRVGIHMGEVYLRLNPAEEVRQGAKQVEVDGIVKVTAARLMGLAGPGQTLITRGAFDVAHRAAHDDLGDVPRLRWISHGLYRLQGIDEPTEVCEVGVVGLAPLASPADTAKASHVDDLDTKTAAFKIVKQRPVTVPVLLLVFVAVFAVGAWTLLSRWTTKPLRSVAVLATTIYPGSESADADILAYTIRNALMRDLTFFEGLSPEAASEIDGLSGPPTEIARAVGADDVVESALACQGRDCHVELRLIRGSDGGIERSYEMNVPGNDLLTVARAASTGLRQLFPRERLRPGHGGFEVAPEDYADYVEIRRAFEARTGTESHTLADLLSRLEEIRRRSPRFVDAYLLESGIAFVLYRNTNEEQMLEKALDLVNEAQSLAPQDPQVLIYRSHFEIRAGKLEAAEATLREMERLVPGDVHILDRRGQLLDQRGAKADALKLASQALERRPSWRRFYRHAELSFEQGKIASARESLAGLFDLYPGHVLGTSLLGRIELVSGDPQLAVDIYTDLVARASSTSRLMNLGLAYQLVQDYGASLSAFERAHAEAPGNPSLLLNLADAHWLLGNTEEAFELYRQVKALIPRETATPKQLTELAQALAHLEEHREAVAAVQSALQKEPEDGEIAYQAALVYALVGDHTAAIVNAENAVELGIAPRWFRLPWFDELRNRRDFSELVAADTETH